MLKIVYVTLTGNSKMFVDKLNIEEDDVMELHEGTLDRVIEEEYILVLPSYEENVAGHIYDLLDEFYEEESNRANCKGMVAAGNLNFGSLYLVTAKYVEEKYGVPIIYKIEFAGSDKDVEEVNKLIGGNK